MLQQDLVKMGSLVEEFIYLAVKSLIEGDISIAEQVIQRDDLLDQMEMDIEHRCLQFIALQQPMASDLRKIGTMLKMATDLERMADHAVDIAKAAKELHGQEHIKTMENIPKLATLVQEMVRQSIDAYVHNDKELALSTSEKDDQIDALYKQLFNELVALMSEHREYTHQGSQLLMIAKCLERIADHATNLNEWVVYQITGSIPDLNK